MIIVLGDAPTDAGNESNQEDPSTLPEFFGPSAGCVQDSQDKSQALKEPSTCTNVPRRYLRPLRPISDFVEVPLGALPMSSCEVDLNDEEELPVESENLADNTLDTTCKLMAAGTSRPKSELQELLKISGKTFPDDELDTAESVDPDVQQASRHLDKYWFRSKVVRRRASELGVETSATNDLETFGFNLAEGLTPDIAMTYTAVLERLKNRITRSNSCEEQRDETVLQTLSLCQGFKRLYCTVDSEVYLMQHYMEGKRIPPLCATLLADRVQGVQALSSGNSIENIFTAVSALSIGDASNAIPLRSHTVATLLNCRRQYMEGYGRNQFVDAVDECLYPKGLVNPCLIQCISNCTGTPVVSFSNSLWVGDVNPITMDVRGIFTPSTPSDHNNSNKGFHIFCLPVQVPPPKQTYQVFPVVSTQELTDSVAAMQADPNLKMFLELPGIARLQQEPMATTIARKHIEFVSKLGAVPHLCPEMNAITPPQLLSLDDELVEERLESGDEEGPDWDNLDNEHREDKGYIKLPRQRSDSFHGVKPLMEILKKFVEEGEEAQPYPLRPEQEAVFVCKKDDPMQFRHGAFIHKPYVKWYHPET